MKHPEKWRETPDPFSLPLKEFEILEILGYPHAGNYVFQVIGNWKREKTEAYIKIARNPEDDFKREVKILQELNLDLAPQIIEYDRENFKYLVTKARPGNRLSKIVGENEDLNSMDYMYEYGQSLAKIHGIKGDFEPAKDRKFFHLPPKSFFENSGLTFVLDYLEKKRLKSENKCFCHGDFHYANILWEQKHISAILDFELAGLGNREYDIAWAVILRPEQKFLKTQEELDLFLSGYESIHSINMEYLRYYMVLIYTHFYQFSSNTDEYRDYIKKYFQNILASLTLKDIQPSQFYISEEKIKKISLWFDINNMDKFQPIPVKILGGLPVMTDGHTRAVYAIKQGLERLPLVLDEDELDWEMYEKCVEACRERGIKTPYDLLDRIISADDYHSKWNAWCDAMQKDILDNRLDE